MQQNGSMQGKRVLVTGSGTGIGREIALEFARQGAEAALHYAHSRQGVASAVSEILDSGGRAAAFQADFTEIEQVRRMAQESVEFLGGLDVLVNNASITMNQPFEKVTPEQFDTLYQVNVRSPFFLTQALLPALIETRGSIISLSSVHALEGLPGHSVYAGTKGAIAAQTRELAIELAPKGVRVNAVAPGAVVVENHYAVDPEYDPEANGRLIPCGFQGTPRDIARVVVFLASEDSRYIVGQTLVIDGGTTSWLPFSDAFRHHSTVPFGRGYVPDL